MLASVLSPVCSPYPIVCAACIQLADLCRLPHLASLSFQILVWFRRSKGRRQEGLGNSAPLLPSCGFGLIPPVATAPVGQPTLTALALQEFWKHCSPLAPAGCRVVTTPHGHSARGVPLLCVLHPALPIESPLIYLSLLLWVAVSCQGPDRPRLINSHSISTIVETEANLAYRIMGDFNNLLGPTDTKGKLLLCFKKCFITAAAFTVPLLCCSRNSELCMLSHGIPTMISSGKFCYYSQFTDEETEIQRSKDTCQSVTQLVSC